MAPWLWTLERWGLSDPAGRMWCPCHVRVARTRRSSVVRRWSWSVRAARSPMSPRASACRSRRCAIRVQPALPGTCPRVGRDRPSPQGASPYTDQRDPAPRRLEADPAHPAPPRRKIPRASPRALPPRPRADPPNCRRPTRRSAHTEIRHRTTTLEVSLGDRPCAGLAGAISYEGNPQHMNGLLRPLEQVVDDACLCLGVGLAVSRELLGQFLLHSLVAFTSGCVTQEKIPEGDVAMPLRSAVIYAV